MPASPSAPVPSSSTVEEFLAAHGPDRDGLRRELVDGEVVVTPSPDGRHQTLSSEIWLALRQATRNRELRAYEAVNVRLSPTRLVIPDVVLARRVNVDFVYLNASDVILAVEIVSLRSASASTDRHDKPARYAEAGIPWLLSVEPGTDSPRAALGRLRNGRYETVDAATGATFRLTRPVAATLPLTVD